MQSESPCGPGSVSDEIVGVDVCLTGAMYANDSERSWSGIMPLPYVGRSWVRTGKQRAEYRQGVCQCKCDRDAVGF